MKRSAVFALSVVLISLMALPALAQVSEDAGHSQLQQKNHEDTDPHYDGNGGINRHQTVGDHGPNGEDYGNFDESNKDNSNRDAGVVEQIWILVNGWLSTLSMLH